MTKTRTMYQAYHRNPHAGILWANRNLQFKLGNRPTVLSEKQVMALLASHRGLEIIVKEVSA